MQVISSNTYASAGKRLLAAIIDSLLLHMVFSALFFRWWGYPWGWDVSNLDFGAVHLGFKYFGHNIIQALLTVAYFSYMESSGSQATIGKMAVGIKVTDVNGLPIALNKALLRNLSKYISMFIFYIGYIMIIFDERKQGLHDKIADTVVVYQ